MKTVIKVLCFSLLSVSAFAQLEVAKGDTASASKSTRLRIGANSAGRLGQKGNTGNFSPYALVSEVTAATGGAITSVNGQSGPTVTLTTTNVAEGTNLYWTTARGNALYPQLTGSYANPAWITSLAAAKVTGLATVATSGSKADVGLGNVDNTSDANKPISTATQTALNGKANTATTLAGYGITDADPYQTAATYAAMNALSFSANTARRVLVVADEIYGKANQWYMVWADGTGTMHADKIVTISEK
ncbi:hypothetical protein DYU11_20950 [Fibrisoma montanum]|uniref:Uncharacterized protein n=1 Tax=Fibrisoma montanum TaxID=2305895 RepID=A0A418M3W6_9BACT|nr:hypothetical protein [Fibrisoma montanum]RIV20516.1 hypothetical protein DYU11_20950 [Fibrisoma montanum]